MKTRLLIISVFLMSFIGTVHASISITPFDLEITSDDFYEAYPYYNPYLIMKRGDSQQITIQVTNNDTTEHTINLFMAKETPRPDRNFVFEPSQLRLESGESATSTLTVGASPDANTGNTILHTLIAQSTSFGTKSYAFYFEITEQITPPSRDLIRTGPDGMMFSKDARFDISESEAFEIIPFDVLPPSLPDEFSFQVMSGSEEEPRLYYSKELLSENTLYSEFLEGENFLIIFEKEEYFTFEEYLQFLNPNEQQVLINGKNGISSSADIKTADDKVYVKSRVTVFLDDVKLRLEAKMPEEQLLKIAESMVIEKPVQELSSIVNKESNRQTGNDGCPVIHFFGYAWEDCGSIFTWSIFGVPLLMIIVAPIGIALAVIIWRIRK